MAKKVKFRCSDGVVEADEKVMRLTSKVVRDLIDMADTDIGAIPLQDTSSRDLTRTIDICELYYDFLKDHDSSDAFRARSDSFWEVNILELFHNAKSEPEDNNAVKSEPEADKAERIREALKFDVGIFVTRFTNQSCATYNWEAIKSLHKVAKYLDINFLQVLTEALIREAPSRKLMEMVSPWVDYNDLEAYRNRHVEAR